MHSLRFGIMHTGNGTVRKGHAKTFSSELIHILLLKLPKANNILRNS
jgi:hypothetical protein